MQNEPKLEFIGTISKRVETSPKKSIPNLTVLYDEQQKQENINLFDNNEIKPEKVEELFIVRYGNELIVQEDEEKLDQAIWKLPNDSESEKNNNNIPKVKISKRTR